MKNHGYQKATMNRVGNLNILPTMILTAILKYFTSKYKVHYLEIYKRSRLVFLMQAIAGFTFFMLGITEFYASTCVVILLSLLSSSQIFIDMVIVNTISDSLFAGMYVTVLASTSNLGRNSTINFKIIDYVGF